MKIKRKTKILSNKTSYYKYIRKNGKILKKRLQD